MATPAKNRHPTKQNNVDSLMDMWQIVPDDDEDMPYVSRAILVTKAGEFHMEMLRGGEVTIPLNEGWHALRVVRVFKTGTTGAGFAGD